MISKRKKILILASYFPPCLYTGGQRPYSWYKHFREFGLEPVVVTQHWDEKLVHPQDFLKASTKRVITQEKDEFGTIIRIPSNSGIRSRFKLRYGERFTFLHALVLLLSRLRYIAFFFDSTSDIHTEADKYLRLNQCELVLATGSPFTLFRYAHLLSQKHDVPWIADYRDGWSTNDTLQYASISKRWLFKNFVRPMEKKFIRNAAMITTVAPSCVNALQSLHPQQNVRIVYNGFNPEYLLSIENSGHTKDYFTIAYAGRIYAHYEVETFLNGLNKFVNEVHNPKLKVVFYGLNSEPAQLQRIMNFNPSLSKYLSATDKLPKQKLFRRLKKSNLLLLLSGKSNSAFASKIFDYLALQRKIILVPGGSNYLSKIMDACNSGISCSDSQAVKELLISLYKEFQTTGNISHSPSNIAQYTWGNQVKLMTTHIKQTLVEKESVTKTISDSLIT